jgi:spore coat protein U-like protein
MFKKLALIAATAALVGSSVAPALAQTSVTSSLTVTAAVAQKCAISAGTVAFGTYDPVVIHRAGGGVDLNGTGTVSVTCTKNSSGVTITLGLGANASGSVRRMLGAPGGEFLTYELYHPSGTVPPAVCTFPGTTVWGTGPGIFTPTGTTWGANSAKTFEVCGTVTKGQDVGTASYTDSVVATVIF